MTEHEWFTCIEPKAMFKVLRCRLRHRKMRLFAVACCHCNWHYFTDQRSLTAVDIAELHSDGAASDDALRKAFVNASEAHAQAFKIYGKEGACVEWGAAFVADKFAYTSAEKVSWMSATRREPTGSAGADLPVQAILVREVFGNPFRPVTIEPPWQTSTVIDLATTIYSEKAFDRMPILADALQDAGCDDEDLIAHPRPRLLRNRPPSWKVLRAKPMTEAEWLTATDPTAMLEFLRGKASDRKLRLFACAWCRTAWRLISVNACRMVVEVTEAQVDGIATDVELRMAMRDAKPQGYKYTDLNWAIYHAVHANGDVPRILGAIQEVATWLTVEIVQAAKDRHIAANSNKLWVVVMPFDWNSAWKPAFATTLGRSCELLRDVFANPFRPVTIDPRWQTSTVIDVAQAIYAERCYERLPILADALEDAGCNSEDIIAHCRGDVQHCRGCWVLDALLGKS